MGIYRLFHTTFIQPRRICVIKDAVLNLLPREDIYDSWLDVGARDGQLTKSIYESAKMNFIDVQTLDIDKVTRPAFKHTVYDGMKMPFADKSFGLVSFIDVLHHTKDISGLLSEGRRIAKRHILIKDHKYEKNWHKRSLMAQDWFGNVNTTSPLTYNFLRYGEWLKIFNSLKLKVLKIDDSVNFRYPFPFNIIYPDNLHFVCLLGKE